MEGNVTIKKENRIATITFAHPAHNAMPGYQLKSLADAIRETGEDEEMRVIILKSGGDRTFCAGASFDELAAIDSFEEGKAFFMGFARVINAMRTCPKFIIGRVQGKAVGGGVGLAASTDYCLATQYASVKLSELALGIGPFVVGPAVERKVGQAAFSQLAIHATAWQTAKWAAEKGLYQAVYPSTEELDKAVGMLARTLSEMSPTAMRMLKQTLWSGTDGWPMLLEERAAISGRLVLSEFTREAIRKIRS